MPLQFFRAVLLLDTTPSTSMMPGWLGSVILLRGSSCPTRRDSQVVGVPARCARLLAGLPLHVRRSTRTPGCRHAQPRRLHARPQRRLCALHGRVDGDVRGLPSLQGPRGAGRQHHGVLGRGLPQGGRLWRRQHVRQGLPHHGRGVGGERAADRLLVQVRCSPLRGGGWPQRSLYRQIAARG
jgi:hypothetical protein